MGFVSDALGGIGDAIGGAVEGVGDFVGDAVEFVGDNPWTLAVAAPFAMPYLGLGAAGAGATSSLPAFGGMSAAEMMMGGLADSAVGGLGSGFFGAGLADIGATMGLGSGGLFGLGSGLAGIGADLGAAGLGLGFGMGSSGGGLLDGITGGLIDTIGSGAMNGIGNGISGMMDGISNQSIMGMGDAAGGGFELGSGMYDLEGMTGDIPLGEFGTGSATNPFGSSVPMTTGGSTVQTPYSVPTSTTASRIPAQTSPVPVPREPVTWGDRLMNQATNMMVRQGMAELFAPDMPKRMQMSANQMPDLPMQQPLNRERLDSGPLTQYQNLQSPFGFTDLTQNIMSNVHPVDTRYNDGKILTYKDFL